MKKIIYLPAFLLIVSAISCKKDNSTTPKTNTNSGMVSGDIYTIAGNGILGYSGDGGQATDAELGDCQGIAVDGVGNLYLADAYGVRKITPGGIITRFAGITGNYGYSGDGSAATLATFFNATGVATDASDNIYIADFGSNVIRIVHTSGIINTIAGNGHQGYSGDGGQATAAELTQPISLALDNVGNIYIGGSDYRVRKVNTGGVIITIAGNGVQGYSGDGGDATSAELYYLSGLAVDNSGDVYIADENNNRIRLVNTSGIISTLAGNGYGSPTGGGFSGDGGPATAAELSDPAGVAFDGSGNLYFAENNNFRIRTVETNGIISTIAGNGYGSPNSGGFSGDGGPATLAELYFPQAIALDGTGNIYIFDLGNRRVREVYK